MANGNRPKIVFLCSGNGGNLRFIREAIERKCLDAQVTNIFVDRQCGALDYAARNEVAARVHDFSAEGQESLTRSLVELEPAVVVSTVHRILLPPLVQAMTGRIVNLHYSLLPAFGGSIGTRPIQQALAYGAKLIGVTAHHVDEGVDTGKPIAQAAFARSEGENLDSVVNTSFRCGCLALLASIVERIEGTAALSSDSGTLLVNGTNALFNPINDQMRSMNNEAVWSALL